jgi:uroporphyrin-3 C-methyltransferase
VRSDLAAAAAAFNKYYDGSAKTTQQALELVAQLQIQMKSTELPRLDDSYAALATASAGK